MLCRSPDSRPVWGVHRASGLFISVSFDADDRVEAIEFGRGGDTVTYNGLDAFATPATDLVTRLRRTTTVHEEEDGHTFTAPELLLTFWPAITPARRFFNHSLLKELVTRTTPRRATNMAIVGIVTAETALEKLHLLRSPG